MPEVRIKTDFGEIVIPYNNLSELENDLKDVDKAVEIVRANVDMIKEKPKVKPGFEDIYYINDDSSVSILKSGSKTENIGIVLFAYDPQPLKVDLISKSSGVKKPTDLMKDSKYFNRLEHGYYKLSSDGLSWITAKVVPRLRKENGGG